MSAQPAYDDDRPGLMRMHIATQRARAACARYRRSILSRHQATRGLRLGGMRKENLAWNMAQQGLIDADGRLRDGFPEKKAARA